MKDKARELRRLFETGRILKIMGAHNGLGARLIERNGFDGVWASGLEISTAHAVPDANILTMTDNLAASQAINDATGLPVVCDCDTGYGNASNVIYMIKKYEAAGLAAAVIEDKRFPKVNSFVPGRQELAPIEEFAGKIEAAKSAQRSPDFMVFARIEALIAGWGMDEALKRAGAYEEAGADGLVIHSKSTTPGEVFEFAEKYKGRVPLIVIPTTYYRVSATELERSGFRMVIYANHGLRAAIQAMDRTFREIHDAGSSAPVEDRIASLKQVFEIQGMHEMKEDEKKFLRRKSIQAVIPAAADHRSQEHFAALLEDRPLCMLKIGDKPLVRHQVDLLRAAGVTDVAVIGGYQCAKIEVQDAAIIMNPDYARYHIMHSIMLARDIFKSQNLIVYSDVLFDRQIVDQLLASPHAITLVVDRAYQTLPFRRKELDLTALDDPCKGQKTRSMSLNTIKPVRKIGKHIAKEKNLCEFIGMALFNDQGSQELCRAWDEAREKYRDKPFYEAASAQQASFTDLVQYMIDSGIAVYGMEIERGWSEVHSLEDYERVNAYFRKAENTISV